MKSKLIFFCWTCNPIMQIKQPKMLMYAAFLVAFAGSNGAAGQKRNLQSMDTASLETFTKFFRSTLLLEIVKTEMENAIEMGDTLTKRNDKCRLQMQFQTEKCMACAKDSCKLSELEKYFIFVLQLLDPAISIVKTLTDITSKLGDAVVVLGDRAIEFLDDMKDLGASASDAVQEGISSTWDEMKDAIDDVADGIVSAGKDVIGTVGDIGDNLVDELDDFGGDVLDGLGDIAGDVKDGLGDIADGIADVGGNFFGGLKSVFGKRRKREITDEQRECMENCASCQPLLLKTKEEKIIAVCGSELVVKNNALTRLTEKIQRAYDTAVNKTHPIVSEIVYDRASMNMEWQLMYVVITVRLNGQLRSYKTRVPYSMMNVSQTARDMAREYWIKA